jgi:hypothetical protein
MAAKSAISPAGLRATLWTLLALDYLVFLIRGIFLFKRRSDSRNSITKWSDISLFGAIILLTLLCAGCDWTARKWEYYSKHPSPEIIPNFGVPLDVAVPQQKVALAIIIVYYCSIWCVKLAFISIYFEFRQRISVGLRHLLYGITAVTLITWVLNFILNLAWCSPIQRTWTFDANFCSPGTTRFLIIFGAATNITSDLLLMSFPIFFLRSIQIPSSQRWAIWILVFFGVVTITCASLRLGFLVSITGATEIDPESFLKVWINTLLFGGIELGVGFIAACLPALRTFFVSRVKGSSGGSNPKELMLMSFRRRLESRKQKSLRSQNTLDTVTSQTELREIV